MSGSSAIPVREGDLLAGKYRVQRVLGAGGMGVVVAARHEQLDQNVAIKFVRSEALDNSEAVARFLNEARAAVKLKSEHAARVLDVGTLESGAPFMVMELLEGCDLATVVAQRGPLPIAVATEYLLQACEAVAEAHAMGIVHRDLKPQNLFLARTLGGSARVKVLDFGVSKSLTLNGGGVLTRTRSMLGSPLYMSPEQMRSSRDVDARSDVWAFGVVLFYLLTARWPFEAESMPELCLKVVSEQPASLAALRPEVPASLVAVVERCLQRDVDQRFADAAQLAEALAPFAPKGSRIAAERARLVMRAARSQLGASMPAESTRRRGPTPTAWGSAHGASGLSPKRASARMWVGVGLLGAGLVVGLALAVHAFSPTHTELSASSASPAPSALDESARSPVPSPAGVDPAPAAAPTATTPAPSADPSGAAPAPVASAPTSGSSAPHAANGTGMAGNTASRPRTISPKPANSAGVRSARAGTRDDDIPSMR
jgi:serine/threonine-protein kinase